VRKIALVFDARTEPCKIDEEYTGTSELPGLSETGHGHFLNKHKIC
jgi:hypothetical protein